MKKKDTVLESILWSIALPGFAQLLNGQLIKGILFILLEVLININANFNEVIRLSFTGQIEESIASTNFKWIMFYPCLYFFAMWDAFKDAGGGKQPFTYLPFVFSAYFVTVGIIFSPYAEVFGVQLGIVWFPMVCTFPGLAVGLLLKRILLLQQKGINVTVYPFLLQYPKNAIKVALVKLKGALKKDYSLVAHAIYSNGIIKQDRQGLLSVFSL